MKTYNLNFVKNKVDFLKNDFSEKEIIDKIKELNSLLKDKTPVFKRLSKTGKITLYNSIGCLIDVDKQNESKYDLLKTVETKRQFVFGGDNERKFKKELQKRLCNKLKLPIFRNGNLYQKSKNELNKINCL